MHFKRCFIGMLAYACLWGLSLLAWSLRNQPNLWT